MLRDFHVSVLMMVQTAWVCRCLYVAHSTHMKGPIYSVTLVSAPCTGKMWRTFEFVLFKLYNKDTLSGVHVRLQ